MDEIIEENVAKQTAYLLGEQSEIEQGSLETKKEVVINMFNNSFSTQMIANCTNLTILEVEEILKDIK